MNKQDEPHIEGQLRKKKNNIKEEQDGFALMIQLGRVLGGVGR